MDNSINDILIHWCIWTACLSTLWGFKVTSGSTPYSLANEVLCRLSEAWVLGYVIGDGTGQLYSDKVSVILSTPWNQQQQQLFLGLVNFYRTFIPNFADNSLPLTDLTCKFAPDNYNGLNLRKLHLKVSNQSLQLHVS